MPLLDHEIALIVHQVNLTSDTDVVAIKAGSLRAILQRNQYTDEDLQELREEVASLELELDEIKAHFREIKERLPPSKPCADRPLLLP